MSRLSHMFHNNADPTTSQTALATGGSAANAATPAPAPSTKPPSTAPASEALPNSRDNLRELIREILEDAGANPAYEGVRRRLAADSGAGSIVHTIGTYLPTPLHDFLKSLVERLHKITRRIEDAPATSPPSTTPPDAPAAPAAPASGEGYVDGVAASSGAVPAAAAGSEGIAAH